MALVNIINVSVMDNPSSFSNPFQFEVTFECLQELPDDLEWKVIYVGNANDSSGDQVLEEVMVGPVSIGINRFILQANAPNPALIANQDLIGVTVILITCSFMDNKFVQIGYYVNNEYSEPFEPENFPNPVDISKLHRNILADQPRVTRYAIDWSGESNGMAAFPAAAQAADDGNTVEDEDDVLDLAGPSDERDSEESDSEDESGDEEGEIDLEGMEEDGVSGEDDDLEVDGDDDDAEGEEDDAASVSDGDARHGGANTSMQLGGRYAYGGRMDVSMMGEDSNSMDVERMMQQ